MSLNPIPIPGAEVQINDKAREAITDLNKYVELNPQNPSAYSVRALKDYTKAIEFDPENGDLFSGRAKVYWKLKDYSKALEDFVRSIELGSIKVLEFLEGPLKDISFQLLKGPYDEYEDTDYYCALPYKELGLFLKKAYDAVIEIKPDVPDGYFHRGIFLMAQENYREAIKDFTKYIELKPGSSFPVFLCGVCNCEIREKDKANEDFEKIADADNETLKDLKLIKDQLKDYPSINNTLNYSRFLGVVGKKSSIENMINSLDIFLNISKIMNYSLPNASEKMIALARYLDQLDFAKNGAPDELKKPISDVFYYYPEFNNSLSDMLKRDGKDLFHVNVKLCFMEYMASIAISKEVDEAYDGIPYTQAGTFFEKIAESDINRSYNLAHTFIYLSKELQKQLIEFNKEKEQEKAQARVDERNKIIADLSHSIKNLISTVIDPLENLKQEKIVKPAVIQNALRGANLVREIVNAMNLSFKGSIEDFYHDVRTNTGKGKMDLESIVTESLRYSIGNMFDGKYFSSFVRKYFPTKKLFEEAKSAWIQVSQSINIQEVTTFLKKYFFKIELSLGSAGNHVIGNEKGSAIKLLILFQELILNAVKYSAFVSKEKRFLHVNFDHNPKEISVKIKNKYKKKVMTKTSGIGHVIVNNFARLLDTEPIIEREADTYSVEIKFENFWEKQDK